MINMNTFIDKLLLFDDLNGQQIELVRRLTRQINLEEGNYFSEPGRSYRQLTFIEKGVLRYNYYNRNAENVTSGFIGEDNFIAGAGSLPIAIPQSEYLQAITACTLLVIEKDGLDELSVTVSNWDRMFNMILLKAAAARRSRVIAFAGIANPEGQAANYLQKFDDLNKSLTLNQILPYFGMQVQ